MDLIEVLKDKTQGMPDEVVITLTSQQGRSIISQLEAERRQREAAETELAEFRGQQEPVAIVNKLMFSDVSLTAHGKNINLLDGTQLFTCQPKPVVVLKSGYLHKSEVIKAIEDAGVVVRFESAGIVVKDGELDTKPARISVIGSYENSSGGLSSIVTLAEHKGVGMCLVCEGKHPPGLPCPSMKVMSGIETNDGE